MTTLPELDGTDWAGTAELWLDPLGDEVVRSDCAVQLGADGLRYTWSHDGEKHRGAITAAPGASSFTDSFHSPQPMACRDVADAWGLLQIQAEYGEASDWRWRIGVSYRTPTEQLVVQMTNVAPWGEEARAVRMVCNRT